MRINHARIATVAGMSAATAAGALAVLIGTGTIPSASTPAPGTPAGSGIAAAVRDFNDGFTAAKQDDCAQGARVACTWLRAGSAASGGANASGSGRSAATVTLTAAESPQGTSGPVLPQWVTVYHSRYRAGAHMSPCYVVGNGTHLNGIVCANGVAYSAAESNGGHPYPHGRTYSRRNLPSAIKWWGRAHNARVVVIGAGNANSTILVTRHSIRES
jgi:hypothetical protein